MLLKRLVFAPLILARHGSLSPQAVILPQSGHRVFLNPTDHRAYKKLVMDSARGRISTPMRFWRDHARALGACLALDVGANYGEVFAYGEYPHSQCVAVEANPILHTYLARTREAHPDAPHIHLEACLVGAEEGGEGSLYYNPAWTGGGSAVPGDAHLCEARVKRRSLDAIVAGFPNWREAPLLLKMDVEGFEGHALEGFTDLFQRERAVGILEFDTAMLRRAGTDPRALFEQLTERFTVYLTFPRQTWLRPLSNWNDLAGDGEDDLHCDLAFLSQPGLLAPFWSIR